MSMPAAAGGKLLWQILAGLAARQTLNKLAQVLVAAVLGVAATYFAMTYVEHRQAAKAMEQVFEETTAPAAEAAVDTPAAETAPTDALPPEVMQFKRALIDNDKHVRVYWIRYSCGHEGFYCPDPQECRDYHDVIRQVEYLNTQPCPDCAKAAQGS